MLRQRKRGGNRRAARVIDGIAEDVVELGRVRGAAVDPRRQPRKRRGGVPITLLRPTPVPLVRRNKLAARRHRHAGQQRGKPVDHHAPRVVHDVVRQRRAGLVPT
jgi:hypothetical protein